MSSSSSSEAWSDDEQNLKKEEVAKKIEERSTPLSRPRHGEKLSFQAPPGYLPSPHSQDLLDQFGRDSLKSNANKQLWIFKIPEEVSPSALDGLVIHLPSTSASNLSQIKIRTPIKGRASQTQLKSYSLRSQISTPRSRDGGTSSTQLIAMAGGSKIGDTSEINHGMAGVDSLQIMLPQAHSQQGRYVFAPVPPKQHLRLVLEEVTYNPAENVATPNPLEKGKRKQPTEKLKGSFVPAGARSAKDDLQEVDMSPSKVKRAKKDRHESTPTKTKEAAKKEKDKKKRHSR